MNFASSVLSLCPRPLFQAGQLTMTAGVTALVIQKRLNLMRYLARHLRGDWGEISAEHREANQLALRDRLSLYSVYDVTPDVQLCFVTDADRTSTKAMLFGER